MAASVADDIVTLQNGTYQGTNNMIHPPSGLSGTSGHPITIRALNDGMATIDGQFAREPVYLKNNNYWLLQGFNAKSGGTEGGLEGYVIEFDTSSYNVMRRVVAWDANMQNNAHVVGLNFSVGNLLEDVAAFGAGRKTYIMGFQASVTDPPNVCRRCWGRWEGSIRGDPKQTFSMEYPGTFNQNICQNCLGTWSAESQPETYTATGSCFTAVTNFGVIYAYGILSDDGDPDGVNRTYTYYGSIAYTKAGDRVTPVPDTCRGNPQPRGVFATVDDSHFNHVIAVISPSNPDFSSMVGIFLANSWTESSAAHISSITNGNDVITWSNVTDHQTATTLAGLNALSANPWTGTTGAQVCYRYTGGAYGEGAVSLTSTPLWPWPMNQRIRDATAAAGSYSINGGPCTGCTWPSGNSPARTDTDVTADIETLLGTIPSTCRSTPGGTPSFPIVTDFPSIAVLDTFDRADSSSLGANWTNIAGSNFTIASNVAAAPASFSRALYTGSQATGSFHEVYMAMPVMFPCCFDFSTVIVFAGTTIDTNNQFRFQISRRTGGQSALIKVVKIDGVGTETTVLASTDLGLDVADGQSFGVRVSTGTISIYWKWDDGNWYRVGQVSDSTLPTGNVYGGFAGLSTMTINDFGFGPAPGTPPSPPNPAVNGACCGGEAGRLGTTFPGVR